MLWKSRSDKVAALYGYLSGDRGTVTKASARTIQAKVQTWQDCLTLDLSRDGFFELWREAGPNGCGPRVLIASGSVSDLSRVASDCEVAA
jgi:hypothetical protein